MRYFSSILLFAVVFSLPAWAQDEVGGIRIGYHSAGVYADGSQLFDSHNNMYVGLFRDNRIIPMLHIGTGLEYFQNGWSNGDDTYRKLHTISVPAYAKLKIGPVFALAGVAANFKVSEKVMDSGQEVEIADDDKAAVFDLPISAGLGVKFLMITVELRYHWGTIESIPGTKNQYLQIGLGVSM
jgi:hypothetical protein